MTYVDSRPGSRTRKRFLEEYHKEQREKGIYRKSGPLQTREKARDPAKNKAE